MTKEDFISFAEVVANLEDEKRTIGKDVKARIEGAADEFGLDKKILKIAIKKYNKYNEDRAEFLATEGEIDNILHSIVGI